MGGLFRGPNPSALLLAGLAADTLINETAAEAEARAKGQLAPADMVDPRTGRPRTERELQQIRDLDAAPEAVRQRVLAARKPAERRRLIRAYLNDCDLKRRLASGEGPTPSPKQRREAARRAAAEQTNPREENR